MEPVSPALHAIIPVRKDSDEPPSLQAYRALLRMIEAGRFGPGARLPTERELATQLSVSRVTVRHALTALQHEGLITATQGSGWYVADEIVEEPSELNSFTEMARRRGLHATARVLVQEMRPAAMDEADQLRIAPGAELFHLERLRSLDGVPVALTTSQIVGSVGRALAELDFSTRSLYEALQTVGRVVPWRADYVLTARGATSEEADALGLAQGAPVLQGINATVDASGRPIEIGRVVYRGDRYRFRTTLRHVARRHAEEKGRHRRWS